MSEILTIDFKSSNLGRQLTTSLKSTGFAVIKNHPISKKLISDIYSEWDYFFKSKEKYNYKFHKIKQDGYFPYLSENAKDSSFKDLKEFFHIYDWGRYPKELSLDTKKLVDSLKAISEKLLFEIDKNSPKKVSQNFSIPLHEMSKDSTQNLLRIIHYPPLDGNENKNAIRAGAHEDINLITLLVAGSESGLQVKNSEDEWVDVSTSPSYIVINVGDMLQECSGHYYPSTTHRVINPKVTNVSRYSMPFFVHARNEVALSKKYTALEYLNERLREIGLK